MPLIAILIAMTAAPTSIDSAMPKSRPIAPGTVAMNPVCQDTKAHKVDAVPGKVPLTHDLDKEPAANLYSAVLHFDGACSRPVIIRENVDIHGKPADGK